MLTKILIFLAVVIGVFVVARLGAASAFRPDSRNRDRKKLRPDKPAQDLLPCPNCGAYVAPGELCDCTGAR